ncbi:hypothetical protein [Snuella sedimenti]|uniref:MG2 domain-containing protein n=1 Tax=Snuella sedimenti TaxID=2798802 RepID=A0A8J7LSY3_9FLAO|nr:hypothetical protein [Snuella sedimenti]MBJ6368925.1 hypothetical protein [Snuella sedimenti]
MLVFIKNIDKRFLFAIFLSLFASKSNSQAPSFNNSYQTYAQLPREIAYLHLNKTTLIKGEDLGFTAYISDKASKRLSHATRNLYCLITDKNDSVIKQQLLKVDNGIASGTMAIDSLLTSGYYTVKAYTNYMCNFREHNHFAQQIRVIDPERESVVKFQKRGTKPDVQLLPEGGHLVSGIPNVMGVIVKDSLGFGIGHVVGELKNDTNETVAVFRVNHLGIGRFLMMPKLGESYHIEIAQKDNLFKIPVKAAEPKGINLKLTDTKGQIALEFKANNATYESIKDDTYTLAIHNGHEIESVPITFSKGRKPIKVFNKKALFTGINIFTLFDQGNRPLLERLYFNYEGIDIQTSEAESKATQAKDTATVTLLYKNIDTSKFNNFSVSVLPADTKSYGAHHNIVSQAYLQPYVRGYIEDAQYYFTDIDKKKQYDLDNLLLTQGWSAYSWDDIFNDPPKLEYSFDRGISIKVVAEKQKDQKFWVHPINDSAPEFLTFSKEEKGGIITEKYPLKGNSIKVSKVQNAGHLISADVKLAYYPNTIISINEDFLELDPKEYNIVQQPITQVKRFGNSLLSNTQRLDEVVVYGKKETERETKIKRIVQGKVDFFSEGRNKYPTFLSYIQARGFPSKNGRIFNAISQKPPAFYINDNRVRSYDDQLLNLYHLPLNEFDYVITNRTKMEFPHFGDTETVQGFVKIYLRDPRSVTIKDIRKRSTKFMPPIAFELEKTFYKPKYPSYHDDFFQEYGVIDWLPENHLNEKGELQIAFPNLEQETVKLFIEGITNKGKLISEIINVKLFKK